VADLSAASHDRIAAPILHIRKALNQLFGILRPVDGLGGSSDPLRVLQHGFRGIVPYDFKVHLLSFGISPVIFPAPQP
jgi:hypothetical protein